MKKPITALLVLLVTVLMAACSSPPRQSSLGAPYDTLSGSEVYVQKGVQYMQTGRLDLALRDLNRAVQLDGKNSQAHQALASLYVRLNRLAEAETHFRKAIDLDGQNYGAHNDYGRFLCSQGRYDQGLAEFQKILTSQLYGLPWVALTNAGRCARAAGKPSEAEAYLRKALESDPRFPPALAEMARLSVDAKQYLSARAFLQRYDEVAEATPESLMVGIQAETALGNREAARNYARLLRERFPDSPEANQAKRLVGLD